jgi:Holliday junction DNA helicase RuvB
MTFRLGYYERGELATIVRRSGGSVSRDRGEAPTRSPAAPRAALRVSRTGSWPDPRRRRVRHGAVTVDVARGRSELLEVDEAGLEKIDRDLLTAIAHKFGGRPVGSRRLQSLGGPDTIEDVYEPYLLQLGSCSGRRGR